MEKIVIKSKPKLIVAGASAYCRIIDFARFREIADKVGAYLMVDMAHIAGLVAVGLHPSPVPYADFVTTTTHKTLRGPRGGMVLCKEEHAKMLDKAVFPGIQGGPLMHVIASKAVAFKEALDPSFKRYQIRILKNATALAESLKKEGIRIVSGGTDNHLMLADVRSTGLTGKEAENRLDDISITCNKNTIPFDPQSPFIASGIRLGTPAVTTRGFNEKHMIKIANIISRTLGEEYKLNKNRLIEDVHSLCQEVPLYEDYKAYQNMVEKIMHGKGLDKELLEKTKDKSQEKWII